MASLNFLVNGRSNGLLMITGGFKVVWVGVSGCTSKTNIKAVPQSVDYVFDQALIRMKRE